MTRRNYLISLRHMLDSAQEANSFVRGRSREDLDQDRLLNLALTRLVVIIGEAANRIPTDEQQMYREIDWPKIVGMRNRLIHEYDVVDPDILWETAVQDLPPLISAIERILGQRP